ncbi:hypothetical protein CC80DRAFT_551166 [Byssothecium circinans]|uniref:Nudix hydrolase domain-containing protein n=1 Tax=Byssothecium circinans TaxID=147558 RepID=A0A6A5TLG0_9PLEO|nr:hypothetical protein CC80DRAFT_551166 [Byssothecium circinans]
MSTSAPQNFEKLPANTTEDKQANTTPTITPDKPTENADAKAKTTELAPPTEPPKPTTFIRPDSEPPTCSYLRRTRSPYNLTLPRLPQRPLRIEKAVVAWGCVFGGGSVGICPRIAAASLIFAEIPAGMVDNESFVGTAAKEIYEETGGENGGLIVPKEDLINMSALAATHHTTSSFSEKYATQDAVSVKEDLQTAMYSKLAVIAFGHLDLSATTPNRPPLRNQRNNSASLVTIATQYT